MFFDLPETPIQVVGAEDGTFDSGDYVLFYGQGTIGYDAENDSHLNPYSDTAYYYVTADGTLGQRIQLLQEPFTVDLARVPDPPRNAVWKIKISYPLDRR